MADDLEAGLHGHGHGWNNPACAEGDTAEDTMNIMGLGNEVAQWNCLPWLTRMFYHTRIPPPTWIPFVGHIFPPPTILRKN
jgi:hypothetical protein